MQKFLEYWELKFKYAKEEKVLKSELKLYLKQIRCNNAFAGKKPARKEIQASRWPLEEKIAPESCRDETREVSDVPSGESVLNFFLICLINFKFKRKVKVEYLGTCSLYIKLWEYGLNLINSKCRCTQGG